MWAGPTQKRAQKKWRMGREPLSAIIGGVNRKFSFTYYLYTLCCHGNPILDKNYNAYHISNIIFKSRSYRPHSILAVTLATTGLLYHL